MLRLVLLVTCLSSINAANFLVIVGKSDNWSEEHGTKAAGELKPTECLEETRTNGDDTNALGDEIGAQCCRVVDNTVQIGRFFTPTEATGHEECVDQGGGSTAQKLCCRGVDYDTAKTLCESRGDRLCTFDEADDSTIQATRFDGSGCNFDRFHIWTSTPCGNECEENTHDCSPNAYCEDTVDSFNCVCKAGFNDATNDGRICEDIDECAISTTNDCSSNAICSNLIGGDRGYECICNPGYTDVDGDGTNCVDTAECLAQIREEESGFEFEDGTGYKARVIEDGSNVVGWSSTGFVVQLKGIIEYEKSKFIGKGLTEQIPNALVGKLSMEKSFGTLFCPMVNQTFSITNDKGLSVSITITTECELKVESWALHKVYFNVDQQEFFRLENFYPPAVDTTSSYGRRCTGGGFSCDDVLDDTLAIYEESAEQDKTDTNLLTEMNYFDLAGITYMSQYLVIGDCKETTASGHFVPEINYNLIYGLLLYMNLLILGLILWECRKCYINRKGNSPYRKVQVHYVDESSQITEMDVE